jgi:hypothetical protein
MNCPEWEERILLSLEGDTDAEAAGHLRTCPECAAFAAGLAADARMLRVEPPEMSAVDFAAMRAAARRESARRSWKRRVVAGLAAAAVILLVSRLALHRDVPQTAHVTPGRPAAQVAHVDHPAAPHRAVPAVAHARGSGRSRDRKGAVVSPDRDLDRQFAEYLRSVEESQRPADADAPAVTRIVTSNPNVIIWMQESKGNDHE